MKVLNQIGHYSFQKENIRFETDLDKMFHKIISSIRYGEKIEVPVAVKNNQEKKDVIKSINKSALYNNIDVSKRWSKDKTKITLTVEG
jgi:phosphoribosylformylglycinamidine (FGAM) synthase PurS component